MFWTVSGATPPCPSGSCIETWVLDRVKREIVHTANHETTHWYPWLFVLWKACGALGVLTFLRRDFTLSARLRYKKVQAPAIPDDDTLLAHASGSKSKSRKSATRVRRPFQAHGVEAGAGGAPLLPEEPCTFQLRFWGDDNACQCESQLRKLCFGIVNVVTIKGSARERMQEQERRRRKRKRKKKRSYLLAIVVLCCWEAQEMRFGSGERDIGEWGTGDMTREIEIIFKNEHFRHASCDGVTKLSCHAIGSGMAKGAPCQSLPLTRLIGADVAGGGWACYAKLGGEHRHAISPGVKHKIAGLFALPRQQAGHGSSHLQDGRASTIAKRIKPAGVACHDRQGSVQRSEDTIADSLDRLFSSFTGDDVGMRSLKRIGRLRLGHWFSYKDMFRATNGFSDERLLGFGGFGRVYKIAVKMSLESSPYTHYCPLNGESFHLTCTCGIPAADDFNLSSFCIIDKPNIKPNDACYQHATSCSHHNSTHCPRSFRAATMGQYPAIHGKGTMKPDMRFCRFITY
uniref:Uncharacterized protein n=1 Tax=Oryza glumipatula TaxID=40148 RepID=A0A0D9YT35_9ORYZ